MRTAVGTGRNPALLSPMLLVTRSGLFCEQRRTMPALHVRCSPPGAWHDFSQCLRQQQQQQQNENKNKTKQTNKNPIKNRKKRNKKTRKKKGNKKIMITFSFPRAIKLFFFVMKDALSIGSL